MINEERAFVCCVVLHKMKLQLVKGTCLTVASYFDICTSFTKTCKSYLTVQYFFIFSTCDRNFYRNSVEKYNMNQKECL